MLSQTLDLVNQFFNTTIGNSFLQVVAILTAIALMRIGALTREPVERKKILTLSFVILLGQVIFAFIRLLPVSSVTNELGLIAARLIPLINLLALLSLLSIGNDHRVMVIAAVGIILNIAARVLLPGLLPEAIWLGLIFLVALYSLTFAKALSEESRGYFYAFGLFFATGVIIQFFHMDPDLLPGVISLVMLASYPLLLGVFCRSESTIQQDTIQAKGNHTEIVLNVPLSLRGGWLQASQAAIEQKIRVGELFASALSKAENPISAKNISIIVDLPDHESNLIVENINVQIFFNNLLSLLAEYAEPNSEIKVSAKQANLSTESHSMQFQLIFQPQKPNGEVSKAVSKLAGNSFFETFQLNADQSKYLIDCSKRYFPHPGT